MMFVLLSSNKKGVNSRAGAYRKPEFIPPSPSFDLHFLITSLDTGSDF
jgi:hypothetical protein